VGFQGLVQGGIPLVPRFLPVGDQEFAKIRTEIPWIHLVNAMVLYLTFLTEVVLLCGFDLKSQCASIWGILRGRAPAAAEVWQERYDGKL
jgi:hypothetical protein